MGDNSPRDRAIAVENSPIGGGEKVVDSMSTEWTDEKHKSYLNSIEASFVKKLYSSKHGANNLLALSRAKIRTNSSASDPKNPSPGQFKVQRRGCWDNLEFERATCHAGTDNESLRLCESPWIQHFMRNSIDKGLLRTSEHQKDNSKVVGQSVHLIDWSYVSEATSSKQLPFFCSQKAHKASIGSVTEGSDQNFVNTMDGRGEEVNRRSGKKRARCAVSPITDQVVPSVTPSSDEKTAAVKENHEECSKMTLF